MDSFPFPAKKLLRRPAARIVAIYLVAGAAWILLSDLLVERFVVDPLLGDLLSVGKGWLFIGITGLILYRYISSYGNDLERSHQTLRESEILFHLFMAHTPIFTFIKEVDDTKSRVLRVSDNFEKMLGRPAAEIVGKTMEELFPPEFAAAMTADDLRVISQNDRLVKEETFNGRTYETVKFPVFRDGAPPLLAGFTIDITERKSLEKKLLHSQKMEGIGTLAGGIAHDFNNILTVINGCSALMERRIVADNPLRLDLDQLKAASARASVLVSRLLTFSRKVDIRPEPANLGEIVRNMEKFLVRVIGEDIRFAISIRAEELIVNVDASQMEQVLMNLVANARDAMPHGGVLQIDVSACDLDETFVQANSYGKPGRYAVMTVTDSGSGMEPETQQRIFEPYFTTKADKGTGLGLATVYGIVRQHQGYITVDSSPRLGTSFRIFLPISERLPEQAEKKTAASLAGGTETILLAEDDRSTRTVVTQILRQLGYTVIEAENGAEAVRLFRHYRDKIDLLVLDVVMPTMNGTSAYSEIRQMAPDINVLFLSGYAADTLHQKDLETGDREVVMKPFPAQILTEKIRGLLDGGGSQVFPK